MGRLAATAVVFDGEHSVAGRACGRVGIGIDRSAFGTSTLTPFCRPFRDKLDTAGTAHTRMLAVLDAVQVAADGADKNVFRVSFIFGQEVAGEEVELVSTVSAGLLLHPEEIFDVRLCGAAF